MIMTEQTSIETSNQEADQQENDQNIENTASDNQNGGNRKECPRSKSREDVHNKSDHHEKNNDNGMNEQRNYLENNNNKQRRIRPVFGAMGGHFFGGPQMGGPPMGGPPMAGPPMTGPPMTGPPMAGPPIGGPPMAAPHVGISQIVPPPGFNVGMIQGINPMMQYSHVMPNIQSIDATLTIPNMNIHYMLPNMIDQNIILMNQNHYNQANQAVLFSWGAILPPIPGVSTPQRRERPNGCRTIFVGGLPAISLDILTELFEKYGTIDSVTSPKIGMYYVRFEKMESVEAAFSLTGYRFRLNDQSDNEATTIFIDYAVNRDDQADFEVEAERVETPPCVEDFSSTALTDLNEKINNESEFVLAAMTLLCWLQRGDCNKEHANTFYSLIQASNNQVRRLFTEKIALDEELNNMKMSIKDRFALVVLQFELVAKILSTAKQQRVSEHFSKQQRRNIEMWFKMTEEVENIKEEFCTNFDDDDIDFKFNRNVVPLEKYELLQKENESLIFELEEYKNEVHLAKDEAERKFEKFKAQFIAQQALQNSQIYPVHMTSMSSTTSSMMPIPVSAIEEKRSESSESLVTSSEARLISILTAFLLAHPLGASLDYLVSYVKSMIPDVTQATVLSTLNKYTDIFQCTTSGVGACIEHKWEFICFDIIKNNQ